MQCLCAIGTGIVGKIAELIVEPVGRQVGYVIHFRSNLQKLEARVKKLTVAKQAVSNEIADEEGKGIQINPNAQLWLENVDKIIAASGQLTDEVNQAKQKCFLGLCPNPTTRHQLSRNSKKLLLEVIELDEKRGFTTVSCGIVRQEVCGISTGEDYYFESRASTLQNIMAELQNPSSKRIGVYGIGGVGKTTLVKQVYKQATEEPKKFFDDVVIILDVKSNPDPEVQKIIVEKLGMDIKDNETRDGRASRLCGRIGSKKVLVILDDLWEKIDLELVGLPNVTTCKILLTSRTKKLLTDMGTDKDFRLDILEDEETWVLFEKKAGDVVKNDAMRAVATQIAECCRGLPVLVVTVASILKKRATLPLWRDALKRLEKGLKCKELTESAFLGLEWSYSQLNDEELKRFFLFCGVIIQGNTIIIQDLLRYGMSLGFFGRSCTLEEARDALDSRVEELKDFCLLIDSDDKECLRMHDLVRDVASQIAFRDHYMLSSGHVDGDNDEWKEWPDKDFLEKCTSISFPRGNSTLTLPEVLQCPALKMFLFEGDNSLEISPRFFEETKQLSVLALQNAHLQSLPSSFQILKKVQTLCLERCELEDITLVGELSNLEVLSFSRSEFKHLPQEIAQLTCLRLLDLSYCYQLQVIPHGVLSSLTRLEDLRMNSFYKWETKGEGTNASLLELKELSRLVTLHIKIPKPIILPAYLFSNCKLERYYVSIGGNMKEYLPYWVDITHNTLRIADDIQLDKGIKLLLKKCEDLHLNGTTFGVKSTRVHSLDAEDFEQVKLLRLSGNVDFTYISQKKIVFPNLTTLKVNGCDRLKYLFTSFMARSLVELKLLEVESCGILEEIVLSIKEDGEENVTNLFTKLESLKLYRLPNLGVHHSLFNEKVVFPNLTTLKVNGCDRLKYLFTYFMARSLVELKLLEVESCGILEEIVLPTKEDGEENMANMFTKLESVKLYQLPNLGVHHSFFNEKVVFPNLTTLKVNGCDRLKYLFTSFMARSLVELKLLEVESCEILEEIVLSTKEDSEENVTNLFTKLESLKLYRLPNLGVHHSLFNEKVVFPNLTTLKVNGCDRLKYLFTYFMARSLVELKLLEVESCGILEEIVLPTKEDGEENMANMFTKLESVKLYQLPNLGVHHSFFNEKVVFPNLTTLKVNGCDRLKYLFTSFMARSLVELKLLEVESCEILEEIVLSTKEDSEENMTNVFTKLESLRFSKLPKLGRFCRSSSYIEFRSLKELGVKECYNLESFVSEPMSSEDKDAVEKLGIERKIAKQLKAGEEENRDGSESKENPDNVENDKTGVRHSLFNEKVAFPNLERLTIHGSKKLSTIWDDQIAHPESFCRLNYVSVGFCPKLINVFPRSIQGRLAALETIKIAGCVALKGVFESKDTTVGDVEDAHIVETSAPREPFVNCHNLQSVEVTICESLKYVFSATVARGLQQLRELTVDGCYKLNVIIDGGDDDGALEAPPRFVFPKVTNLKLRYVGEFKSLYPGRHTSRWPSLKQSDIVINFLDKRVFEQESFPQLEQLTLYPYKEKWGPPPPADFFPKLKSISFVSGPYRECKPFTEPTLLFLDELRNQLETIQVYHCDDEMLVDDGEIHPATTFHHLTSLKLSWMRNLLHLENPKSRSADTGAADPVFPNLTFLSFYECNKLTSLESSAISFRHLTTLKVRFCGQLKYLFPYSVAKSLEQLTKLQVKGCNMLEVIIIATDIDDDDAGKDEIVHLNWRLQSLSLKWLPKLQGFVSGNCIVKVPSSVHIEMGGWGCPVKLKVSPDGVLQVTEVSERNETEVSESSASEAVDEEDED